MDKPSFARKSPAAKANHTDGGDLSIRPAIAPAENGDLDEIKSAVLAKLALELGKDASAATDRDWFVAAALTIRDRVVHRWLTVDRTSHAQGRKRVYYLSLEFLIGRLFADVLCNLGWTETFRAALGYGEGPHLLGDFSSRSQDTRQALAKLKPCGNYGAAMMDAVSYAIGMLNRRKATYRR